MKLFYRILPIVILLLSVIDAAYSNCGNNSDNGLSGSKNCPAPASGPNMFYVYTGNVHREIRDLEVWGGVGDKQLVWMRYYNSRNGWEIWTHAYDYRMTYEGLNEEGRQQIQITYPEGGANTFTRSIADTNVWLPALGVNKWLFQQGNNYFLQTAEGYRYRFEKMNSTIYGVKYQLQDFRDPSQNLYTLTYDDWHNLLRVTEPAGRFLAIEYAALHGKLVISKVKTNDGRSTSYNYTLHDDGILDWLLLSSVNYGDGTTAIYKYAQSEPGRLMLLEHAIDPRLSGTAVNIKYVYDNNVAEGYIKEEKNGVTGDLMVTLTTKDGHRWVCYSNGRVQHYTMPENLTGSVIAYSDGLGRTTQWGYEDGGFGFIKSETDALGRITYYKKSIYGNDLEIIHPDGSKEKWTRDDLDLVLSYTDELGNVTIYTRDHLHRVTRITYADGTNEQFTYNSFGQVLTHKLRNGGIQTNTYNSQGLKISSKNALGNITVYSYDVASRVATVTNALGHITSYEYNERGLIVKITNADNSFKVYGYDNSGNQILVKNELGNSWKKVYDDFKRVISSTDPLNRETKYSYEIAGGLCGCTHAEDKPTKIVLPGGKTTTIEYDAEWQKTKEIVGAGSPEAATVSYEYDAAGNLARFIDAGGKSWAFGYDARDRKQSATDPLGHTSIWMYDASGNLVGMKRPDNGLHSYQYDNMNRRIREVDPKGQVTTMLYDDGNNLIKLTDANNRIYVFDYDLLNRRLKLEYPDGSGEHYTYDAAGNQKTYTNRSGVVLTYTYDNRNRQTGASWSDITPAINTSYDAASRVVKLWSVVSELTYGYNDANELLYEMQDITGAGGPKQVSYTYNADGWRNSMTYPDGSTILSYDYTGRNQLSSINLNGAYLVSYAYDLKGNRISQFRKNAVGTNYTYNDANQLTSITHQKAGVSFNHLDYGYDNMNRRTFMRRNYGKGDVYTYDATDQLIGVQYDASNPAGVPFGATRSVDYNFDATGNRVQVNDNGNVTNYASNNLNQYTSVGLSPVTYDASGNLKSLDGWAYTYDAQNRLIKAQKAGTEVIFAYDAKNRCVKRTVNGVNTYLYYDEWNLIKEITAGISTEYIHGAEVDDLVCSMNATTGMLFYHHDALGNVTELTDASGNVKEQYAYDVFGAVTIKDGSGNLIPASGVGNRFLFTGREFIKELSLYDYRNRIYSPYLGRFLQTDPLRFLAGDINLYRYVGNNPVNLVDPTGEFGEYSTDFLYRPLPRPKPVLPPPPPAPLPEREVTTTSSTESVTQNTSSPPSPC